MRTFGVDSSLSINNPYGQKTQQRQDVHFGFSKSLPKHILEISSEVKAALKGQPKDEYIKKAHEHVEFHRVAGPHKIAQVMHYFLNLFEQQGGKNAATQFAKKNESTLITNNNNSVKALNGALPARVPYHANSFITPPSDAGNVIKAHQILDLGKVQEALSAAEKAKYGGIEGGLAKLVEKEVARVDDVLTMAKPSGALDVEKTLKALPN